MDGRMQRRHQQSGCGALTGDVTQRNHEATVLSLDEVVIVAADFVTRETDPLKFISGNLRWGRRLKTLLDLAGQLQFALQAFAIQPRLNQPRVLNPDGRD